MCRFLLAALAIAAGFIALVSLAGPAAEAFILSMTGYEWLQSGQDIVYPAAIIALAALCLAAGGARLVCEFLNGERVKKAKTALSALSLLAIIGLGIAASCASIYLKESEGAAGAATVCPEVFAWLFFCIAVAALITDKFLSCAAESGTAKGGLKKLLGEIKQTAIDFTVYLPRICRYAGIVLCFIAGAATLGAMASSALSVTTTDMIDGTVTESLFTGYSWFDLGEGIAYPVAITAFAALCVIVPLLHSIRLYREKKHAAQSLYRGKTPVTAVYQCFEVILSLGLAIAACTALGWLKDYSAGLADIGTAANTPAALGFISFILGTAAVVYGTFIKRYSPYNKIAPSNFRLPKGEECWGHLSEEFRTAKSTKRLIRHTSKCSDAFRIISHIFNLGSLACCTTFIFLILFQGMLGFYNGYESYKLSNQAYLLSYLIFILLGISFILYVWSLAYLKASYIKTNQNTSLSHLYGRQKRLVLQIMMLAIHIITAVLQYLWALSDSYFYIPEYDYYGYTLNDYLFFTLVISAVAIVCLVLSVIMLIIQIKNKKHFTAAMQGDFEGKPGKCKKPVGAHFTDIKDLKEYYYHTKIKNKYPQFLNQG